MVLAASRDEGGIEVAVSDTGIGIAPEDQDLVFEEFRQVGGGYARTAEGTGLGLTLTRRFVEMHGGRIWVESEVDKGSAFTFTLPLEPASAPGGTGDETELNPENELLARAPAVGEKEAAP